MFPVAGSSGHLEVGCLFYSPPARAGAVRRTPSAPARLYSRVQVLDPRAGEVPGPRVLENQADQRKVSATTAAAVHGASLRQGAAHEGRYFGLGH
jgi:hypothetical protein